MRRLLIFIGLAALVAASAPAHASIQSTATDILSHVQAPSAPSTSSTSASGSSGSNTCVETSSSGAAATNC